MYPRHPQFSILKSSIFFTITTSAVPVRECLTFNTAENRYAGIGIRIKSSKPTLVTDVQKQHSYWVLMKSRLKKNITVNSGALLSTLAKITSLFKQTRNIGLKTAQKTLLCCSFLFLWHPVATNNTSMVTLKRFKSHLFEGFELILLQFLNFTLEYSLSRNSGVNAVSLKTNIQSS